MLLLQEFDFEVIVNLRRLNVGPHHIFKRETQEEPTSLEDSMPDTQIFSIKVVDDDFADIIQFLSTGMSPTEYTTKQKMELVV